MEERCERTFDDGQELTKSDASHSSQRTPSLQLGDDARSQEFQGQNSTYSNSTGDEYVQYIERRIKLLENSLKESLRSLTNKIEKRFIELETNVNKIQHQVQFIQQHLHMQYLRRYDSLTSLQPEPEDCGEDCEKSSCCSSESIDTFPAYVQRMQKYQERFGAKHLSLKPSRVMRQKRVYSRNSLSLPSNTVIL